MNPPPAPTPGDTLTSRHRFAISVTAVAALAFSASIAFSAVSGFHRPMKGDAAYFLSIGTHLAGDWGDYRNDSGFRANVPDTERAPGWPVLIAVAIRLGLGVPPAVASRIAGALLHAATAALVALIAKRLGAGKLPALIGGAVQAVSPIGLQLAAEGMSENAFLALALSATLLALTPGRLATAAATLIFGLACLVRQFFVLFPIGLVLASFRRPSTTTLGTPRFQAVARWTMLLAVFALPTAAWVARNYWVTGAFPVLSTLRGETLYGANNPVVASDLRVWGYWIMPDEIPGERSKRELTRDLGDVGRDRYYVRKAIEFLQGDRLSLPRHLVGKLVRGYVPIPWVPDLRTYAAYSWRLALYIGFALALHRAAWSRVPPIYRRILLGMAFVSLATTLVFYGTYRFTYCLEPFLLPVIACTQATRREIGSTLSRDN
jgi:hypothetical protein